MQITNKCKHPIFGIPDCRVRACWELFNQVYCLFLIGPLWEVSVNLAGEKPRPKRREQWGMWVELMWKKEEISREKIKQMQKVIKHELLSETCLRYVGMPICAERQESWFKFCLVLSVIINESQFYQQIFSPCTDFNYISPPKGPVSSWRHAVFGFTDPVLSLVHGVLLNFVERFPMKVKQDFKWTSGRDVSHRAFRNWLRCSALSSQSGANQVSCRMNQIFICPWFQTNRQKTTTLFFGSLWWTELLRQPTQAGWEQPTAQVDN